VLVTGARRDAPFFPLATRERSVRTVAHNFIPAERREDATVPLWLTERGVLVRATKLNRLQRWFLGVTRPDNAVVETDHHPAA
jgi:hypothetical protein